jgi:hypothetical protein
VLMPPTLSTVGGIDRPRRNLWMMGRLAFAGG